MKGDFKFIDWQNHPVTRQFLNSPLYRPYMWTRYGVDNMALPIFAITKKNKKRDFHAYVIGTMKSGTTSFGRVLSAHYRTRHEALPRQSCLKTALFRKGHIMPSNFRRYIILRDQYLNLELESSYFLLDWADILVNQFPTAKFILPIREPYSWLRSMINQEASTNLNVKDSYWKLLFDEYFKDDEAQKDDAPLLESGLHSISGYLKYWNHHHLKLINTIPSDRLLIIRTDQISHKINEISDFLGIPKQSFHEKRMRQNTTSNFYIDSSKDINQNHIKYCIRKYCSASLLTFFPEIEH